MQIGKTDIHTPYISLGDLPTDYAADWRHQVARELSVDSSIQVPNELSDDVYIRNHVAYLRTLAEATKPNSNMSISAVVRQYPLHHLAMRLYSQDNSKYYLEPLLLTRQPLEVVSADMGLPLELVKLYERLFFASRDNDGNHQNSCYIRTALAMNNRLELNRASPVEHVWRTIAAQLGYTALSYQWSWNSPSGDVEDDKHMFQYARHEAHGSMMRRLKTGTIQPIDTSMYLGHINEAEHLSFEMGQGVDKQEDRSLVIGILQIVAPQLKTVARIRDQYSDQDDAWISIANAKRNIQDVEVIDNGPVAGDKAIQTMIDKKSKSMGVKR